MYYALFGECCCFCQFGSGIVVHTAPHPLGPWTTHRNIGCETQPSVGCGCGIWIDQPTAPHVPPYSCPNLQGQAVTRAQQNFVIRVQTPVGEQFLWNGDMWQSAADGVKGRACPFPVMWFSRWCFLGDELIIAQEPLVITQS